MKSTDGGGYEWSGRRRRAYESSCSSVLHPSAHSGPFQALCQMCDVRTQNPGRGNEETDRLAERVGRKPENHGSKPTTISVGFRGKAILGVFSIRKAQNQAESGQIKGSKRSKNRGQFVAFQSN